MTEKVSPVTPFLSHVTPVLSYIWEMLFYSRLIYYALQSLAMEEPDLHAKTSDKTLDNDRSEVRDLMWMASLITNISNDVARLRP